MQSSRAPGLTVACIALCLTAAAKAGAEPLDLVLPTDNDALFRGEGAEFYQYVERDYKGVKSTPWEGGRYGFVRDPIETSEGIVFTRFHEGIDIRALQRDAKGEPLDEVRSIAAGKVVHVSEVAGYSNYGKYVVIEHHWDGSSFFSLYGHLSEIAVRPGNAVARGQRIGRMGHTGTGINQARSHVHLELNMLLSHEFNRWHQTFFPGEQNHHDIYNGLNLAGLDIARLYLTLRQDPDLTVSTFVRGEAPFYTVAIPRSKHFELPHAYPWLLSKEPGPSTQSWLVSFAASGLPVNIEPSPNAVSQAAVVWVKKTGVDCKYLTRGDVAGRGNSAHLSDTGHGLMKLLTFPD